MYNTTPYLWAKLPECIINPTSFLSLLPLLAVGPRIYLAGSIEDFVEEKDKVGGAITMPLFPLPDTWFGKYAVLLGQPVTFYRKDNETGILSDETSELEVKLDYSWNNWMSMLSIPAIDVYIEKNELKSGMMLEDVYLGYRKRDKYIWLMMYNLIGEAETSRESSLSPAFAFVRSMR